MLCPCWDTDMVPLLTRTCTGLVGPVPSQTSSSLPSCPKLGHRFGWDGRVLAARQALTCRQHDRTGFISVGNLAESSVWLRDPGDFTGPFQSEPWSWWGSTILLPKSTRGLQPQGRAALTSQHLFRFSQREKHPGLGVLWQGWAQLSSSPSLCSLLGALLMLELAEPETFLHLPDICFPQPDPTAFQTDTFMPRFPAE